VPVSNERSDRAELLPSGSKGAEPLEEQTGKMHKMLLEGITFVCNVFWGPDLDFCTALHKGDVPVVFNGHFPRNTMESMAEKMDDIRRVVQAYPDPETLLQGLDQQYITLFISSIDGVAAPLYHSCYIDAENGDGGGMLMGQPAVDMKSRLSSVGLKLDENLHQMPDHLCVELEYLFFLLKEGGAQQEERIAMAESFAVEEMLPWVREFQDRLSVADKDRFYSLVAMLLMDLLTCIGKQGDSLAQDEHSYTHPL